MASLIIPGSKSITISNRTPHKNIRDQFILIGNNGKFIYKSYIFFDISSIPVNASILSAQLVLFRRNYCNIHFNSFFNVYPLKDDFSTYTTYKVQPQIYDNYKKVGQICKSKVSVEVDIKEIIIKWLNGTIINKGLAIEDEVIKATPPLSFGSTLTKNQYIIPILRIVYYYSFNNNMYSYLPVTINYADYVNPSEYGNKCRLIITAIVTIGNKTYHVSKEYDYIPVKGTDVINVAYIPQEGVTPIVEIACSYYNI